MFRIGEFSRLTQVTVKALRYYDEVGLLQPAAVDELTGYRSYSLEQVPRLNRVLALKELGLSLEQIALLLHESVSLSQLQAMLHDKQAELEARIREEHDRLARVEARLRQIEQEEPSPDYEVRLKEAPPQRVATLRERIGDYQDVGRLFDELRGYVHRHRIQPTAWMAIWHTHEEGEIDAQAAVAAPGVLPADGPIQPEELPGVETLACVLHHGPFQTIHQAYRAAMTWIPWNGYRIAGPIREWYYHAGNDRDDPSYITEVQFPITRLRKAARRSAIRKSSEGRWSL
jgi:DNA-binding transcriptional MerR regulator